MREIKLSLPSEATAGAVRLGIELGIKTISVADVSTPDTPRQEVKFKTSSPRAHQLLKHIYQTSSYRTGKISISSHSIRGLDTRETMLEATRPFCVLFLEIEDDFWQNTHLTLSFIIRVIASALLLTYGMLNSKMILMIGAMLFTVFSPALMAIGFGLPAQSRSLITQGVKAFLWANGLSILAAIVVTLSLHEPLPWDDFGSVSANLFIAVCAGIVGAISDADDAGRRQLLAIAAAFPYSRFPPWIGICLVQGFPARSITLHHLGIFGLNIVSMILSAAVVYATLGVSPRNLGRAGA